MKDTKGINMDHKSQKILIREHGTFRAGTKAGSWIIHTKPRLPLVSNSQPAGLSVNLLEENKSFLKIY